MCVCMYICIYTHIYLHACVYYLQNEVRLFLHVDYKCFSPYLPLDVYAIKGPFRNCVISEGWGYGHFCYGLLGRVRGFGGHSSLLCNIAVFNARFLQL